MLGNSADGPDGQTMISTQDDRRLAGVKASLHGCSKRSAPGIHFFQVPVAALGWSSRGPRPVNEAVINDIVSKCLKRASDSGDMERFGTKARPPHTGASVCRDTDQPERSRSRRLDRRHQIRGANRSVMSI